MGIFNGDSIGFSSWVACMNADRTLNSVSAIPTIS